jgi:AraC family transcriptional regulator, regulatory protein of adaptative response / methylated-DNA-[protein]-cysteine methyltransferase
MIRLSRAIVKTPLGDMMAIASDSGLCALEFTGPQYDGRGGRIRRPRLPRLAVRMKRWFPPHEIQDRRSPVITQTRGWLADYFRGAGADVADLPIEMHGAPFEKEVWKALLRIPPGETRSYGSIAKDVGAPHAARAVGAANGANPIAIIVPCHRVIGSLGSLIGYGGGLDRKSWLLDHERRWRRDVLF